MMVAWFIIKRLAGGAIVLLVLSFVVFALIAISPGSPIQTLLGTRPASPDLVSALNAKYHLDQPLMEQYLHWLGNVIHLNFGDSISVQNGSRVWSVISDRIALSSELAAYAVVLTVCIGIPIGMAAGVRHGGTLDRIVSFGATMAVGAPSYVVAILLLYVFGAKLAWFPIYGVGTGGIDRIAHLTLPACALAAILCAMVVRQTRATTLTVMQQDYITFARLRGLGAGRVLLRYAFRNSALPVVATTGVLLIGLITGAVFVERVFSLPGVGSLLLESVTSKDVPLVQGLAMVIGAFVVLVNLAVDLLSLVIDPRTRSSVRGSAG